MELQMYAPGQTNVTGKTITTYDAAGNLFQTFTLDANVPNGESQRTILIGNLSVDEDLTENLNIPTDGAVCFANVDCVASGSISNLTNLTSPAGTPFPGGMPTEFSLQRKITAGCPTLLEASDDTNDSAADFVAAAPTPRRNTVSPTETPCPTILEDLKSKVKGRRATITGKIEPPPGDSLKINLFANGSPLRKVARKTATLDANSEFKKRFKVPAESTRCKVKVAFHGDHRGGQEVQVLSGRTRDALSRSQR